MTIRSKTERALLNQVWHQMIRRCTNLEDNKYSAYGGRGIRVCKRWVLSFEDFLSDVGPRPPGKTLERIHNDGNYEPGNVRWATAQEQAWNRRSNRLVTVGDETLPITEWARRLGISHTKIISRIKRGWSAERACSSPITSRGAKARANNNGTRMLTLNGETRSLSAWSKATGLGRTSIVRRLDSGWSVSDALTCPAHKKPTGVAA